MLRVSSLLLNFNACRFIAAMAVTILVSSGSPLWWTAAIPWFLLNLPGLLLFIIPSFALFLRSTRSQPVDWIPESFLLILLVVLPTAISMALSYCWRPLFKRTGALGQFYYPGS